MAGAVIAQVHDDWNDDRKVRQAPSNSASREVASGAATGLGG